MKDWIIRKLGGSTEQDVHDYVAALFENHNCREEIRDELRLIPVRVKADHPDVSKCLRDQKTFINACCKVLGVKKIW